MTECPQKIKNLSRGLDSLPQAEVQDEDNQNKAEGELPARKTQVIDASTLMNVQHPAPGGREVSEIIQLLQCILFIVTI